MWDKDKVVKWLEEHPDWLFAVFIITSVLMTITEIAYAVYQYNHM